MMVIYASVRLGVLWEEFRISLKQFRILTLEGRIYGVLDPATQGILTVRDECMLRIEKLLVALDPKGKSSWLQILQL